MAGHRRVDMSQGIVHRILFGINTDDDIVHNSELLMRENVYTPKIVRIFTHNQKAIIL